MFKRTSRAVIAFAFATAMTGALPQTASPVQVQPSGSEVPANLLRISLSFAAPQTGPVLPHLGLRRTNGDVVQQPFLEQELWSPSGRTLTVLLHPGRVKSGLEAREKVGPVLLQGEGIVLTLDGRDIKQWSVGRTDTTGPKPSSWRVSQVSPGSRQTLTVQLDGAVDGRDVDYFAVIDTNDHRLPGLAQLRNGEKTWAFTPAKPWRSGSYRLVAYRNLEDPSGNRMRTSFETVSSSPPVDVTDAVVPFAVGRAERLRH